MEPAQRAARKALLLKLTVAAVVLGAAAVLVLRGVGLQVFLQRGIGLITAAGPAAFFLAMAVLPAVGAPMMAFALPSKVAFGAQLGTAGVLACALAAMLADLLLAYWLARSVLRPSLARLLTRLGYQLPSVAAADATDLIILVRVTPGVPFFVQNYLLGLAGVPVLRYAVISFCLSCIHVTAFVLLGDALERGQGKLALLAFSILMALAAGAHLARKHYGRKQKPAAAPAVAPADPAHEKK